MKPDIDSPTGLDLDPRPPETVRLRRSIGVVIVALLGLVVAAIVYEMHERQQEEIHTSTTSGDEQKAHPATGAGQQITASLPSVIASPTKPDSSNNEPGLQREEVPPVALSNSRTHPVTRIPGAGQTQPDVVYPTASQLPEDSERVRAYQQEREAIESPTSIGGGRPYSSTANTTPSYQTGGQLPNVPAPLAFNASAAGAPVPTFTGGEYRGSGGISQTAEYNAQNGQAEKNNFLIEARKRATENYLPSVRTAPLTRCEVKAGWDIPAILEQAINSDLPGDPRALVRENVYDTATGTCVAIPQGSRLIGHYNSVVAFGQNGLQAVWDRLIFPDGSSLNLNGMIGQDAQGQSGLRHSVDQHYLRLAGFAVLTSLFSAGFQLSQNRPGTILATPNAGEVVAGAVGSEISQVGVEITRRNLNVQPTIKIPAGYRFNVRVNRDIAFDTPYSPFR